MFDIEQFLSLDGYDTDTRVSRRKNSEVNSQEFFTPYSIVKRMADKIPNEDILKENGGKKFDVVLMNPPYDRSLHLKFLEKTIQIANTVISIQPTTWLDDIGGRFKDKSLFNKYKKSIGDHIESIDKIIGKNATNAFGKGENVAISNDLGIYVCNKIGGYDYELKNEFPFNLYKKKELPFKIGKYKDNLDKNFVPIGNIQGCVKRGYPAITIVTKYGAFKNGKNKENKTFKQLKDENPRFTFGNINEQNVIIFDTYNEAENFYKLCNTTFWKIICYKSTSGNSIPIDVLPWPKNYKEEWTDKKLFEYFKLSDKDIDKYYEIFNELKNRLKNIINLNSKDYLDIVNTKYES